MADDNAVLELLPEEGVVERPAVSKSEAQMIDVAATLIQARMRSSIARKVVTKTRVVSGKKKETFTTLEQMDLFILPDVDLELAVSYSRDAARKGHAGRFVITGPVDSLVRIRKMVGRSGEISGVISPKNSVTLPEDVRRSAGIPLAATHFAFISPLADLKGRLEAVNLAQDPWAFACLLGGFAYFDGDSLLAINAISIIPSTAVLHLAGPYRPRPRAGLAMESFGRVAPVTIDGLLEAGFMRFGWSARRKEHRILSAARTNNRPTLGTIPSSRCPAHTRCAPSLALRFTSFA